MLTETRNTITIPPSGGLKWHLIKLKGSQSHFYSTVTFPASLLAVYNCVSLIPIYHTFSSPGRAMKTL